MIWRNALALWMALSFAYHAASVYQKFGFWAYCVAMIFMLTFGECIRVWIRMVRGKKNADQQRKR